MESLSDLSLIEAFVILGSFYLFTENISIILPPINCYDYVVFFPIKNKTKQTTQDVLDILFCSHQIPQTTEISKYCNTLFVAIQLMEEWAIIYLVVFKTAQNFKEILQKK